MTNSFQAQQSDGFFRSLSLILAGISIALVGFVMTLIITGETTVAHGESIDDPQELNAEFFADNTSGTVVANANVDSDLNADRNMDAYARSILAQAQNGDQSGQCDYLTNNLRIDLNNDSQQIYRLQAFLQAYAYDYVELTGEFDEATLRAVQSFQTRHAEDILEPWGYEADEATGYVYITTRQKINEIYCNQEIDLTSSEQSEIANYRQKLNQWRAQGAEFDTPQYLAEYRSQQSQSDQEDAGQSNDESSDESTAEATNEDEVDGQETEVSDRGETANETTEVDDDINGTSTTATDSSQVEDEPGFFGRLFGQNGSNESDNDNEETATTTESNEGGADDDGEATSNGNESTTGTSATSGVDKAATSVYSGVNSFVGFIFSPTFLLILLGVLILLLIATLLEDENDDAYADITADDFAKDFEDSVDEGDTTDNEADVAANQQKADSKTQSADFDDTPAGDTDESSDDSDGKKDNLNDTSSSS